jgi:NADPH2:quinone reductase
MFPCNWRALGGVVWATGSEHDRQVVSRLGATPIDYRKQTVEQYVESCTQDEGFDLVVDTVGGATLDASFGAVKHFGHVVSALGRGAHALAPLSFREATYSGVFTLHLLLTGKYRSHHGEILAKQRDWWKPVSSRRGSTLADSICIRQNSPTRR